MNKSIKLINHKRDSRKASTISFSLCVSSHDLGSARSLVISSERSDHLEATHDLGFISSNEDMTRRQSPLVLQASHLRLCLGRFRHWQGEYCIASRDTGVNFRLFPRGPRFCTHVDGFELRLRRNNTITKWICIGAGVEQ